MGKLNRFAKNYIIMIGRDFSSWDLPDTSIETQKTIQYLPTGCEAHTTIKRNYSEDVTIISLGKNFLIYGLLVV